MICDLGHVLNSLNIEIDQRQLATAQSLIAEVDNLTLIDLLATRIPQIFEAGLLDAYRVAAP